VIEIKNLSFSYQAREVLDHISLSICSGTTTALIGPSGCGKTTLLYLIAGLVPYDCGEIFIRDKKVAGVRETTGIILQNYGLFPWKTIESNILIGMIARKIPLKLRREKLENILSELDIAQIRHQFPSKVSGGQKQRSAIARTLVLDPDLLLMDEASSALDAMTKEVIQDLLLKIFKARRTTMLFVTHSIEEAVFLGQRIVVMKNGRISKICENPDMGIPDHRTDPSFYQMCAKIRDILAR
jgi:NitT/TauT family transport system ATP-binding protein